MVSGSAPLSPEVGEFLRICIPGATLMEGYGMTESTCVITAQVPTGTPAMQAISAQHAQLIAAAAHVHEWGALYCTVHGAATYTVPIKVQHLADAQQQCAVSSSRQIGVCRIQQTQTWAMWALPCRAVRSSWQTCRR